MSAIGTVLTWVVAVSIGAMLASGMGLAFAAGILAIPVVLAMSEGQSTLAILWKFGPLLVALWLAGSFLATLPATFLTYSWVFCRETPQFKDNKL